MTTQTGSISFESTKGLQSYAKQNYATLSQIKGQFATCGTGASTAAKVATIVPEDSDWTLYNGATITVKFTSKNTTTAPTLNVNNTGAKPIKGFDGSDLTEAAREWPEGAAMAFTYDGTYWRIQDSNLMERVHTAETGIEQTANSILSFATMGENYTDPDGNVVENQAKSYIDQTASGITQNISRDYATKAELSDAASTAEISKSMSGERSLFTENAAPLPLIDLTAFGESVQDGTPTPDAPVYIQAVRGKNLLNCQADAVTSQQHGLTIKYKDHAIRISGVCSDTSQYVILGETPLLEAGSYYVVVEGDLSYGTSPNGMVFVWKKGVSTKLTQSFIADGESQYRVGFATNGESIDATVKLQVIKGYFDIPYSPYESVAIISRGKNLVSPSANGVGRIPAEGYNYANGAADGQVHVHSKGIAITPNTEYTFSFDNTDSESQDSHYVAIE